MSNANGKITKPVTTTDVSTVLGVASHDVGTLCTSEKIKMFSRFKPVIIVGGINPDRSGKWWKGSAKDCGIKVWSISSGTSSAIASAIAMMDSDDELNGWSYDRPTGGEAAPLRLGDFDGYDHKAAFAWDFSVPQKIAAGGKIIGSAIMPIYREEYANQPGSLTPYDIEYSGKALSEYYLGMVVTNSSKTVIGSAVGTKDSCEFNVSSSYGVGTKLFVYPFLSLNASLTTSGVYVIMPYIKGQEVSVVSALELKGLEVSVSGTLNYGALPHATWTLTLTTTKAVTINSGTIKLRFRNSSANTTLQSGEQQTTISSMTLAAGTTKTEHGIFTGIDSTKDYVLHVELSTSAGSFSSIVNMDSTVRPIEPATP